MRKLARFFVIAGHFEQALRAPERCAVLGQIRRGHLRGFFFFQARVARVRGFVRFDARGAEHDDGVADALALQLHQRVNVFAENADRAGRRAL